MPITKLLKVGFKPYSSATIPDVNKLAIEASKMVICAIVPFNLNKKANNKPT